MGEGGRGGGVGREGWRGLEGGREGWERGGVRERSGREVLDSGPRTPSVLRRRDMMVLFNSVQRV